MNNENNNEILSFEELHKKLGMDEPSKKESKPKVEEKVNPKPATEDIFTQIEQTLNETTENEPIIETKQIVENGKTFVDNTEQYVKKETISETEIKVEAKRETVAKKKKKVAKCGKLIGVIK